VLLFIQIEKNAAVFYPDKLRTDEGNENVGENVNVFLELHDRVSLWRCGLLLYVD